MTKQTTPAFTEIASGLRFPEGPIALPNGDILLVEIERGTLTRVTPKGDIEVIAQPGGGPNGAAMGPDGKVYLCNNGGFAWSTMRSGGLRPGHQAHDYSGGRIERVDLTTGGVEVLYTHGPNGPLKGPNDLVFDGHGGFWFTDLGKSRDRDLDREGVLVNALNVIGRITLRAVEAGGLIDHASEAVEADHRAIEGGEVNCAHGITVLSFKATVGDENHPV
jgi:sugar lactone lactonase YvrE